LRGKVQRAGDQAVVHDAGPGHLRPFHGDAGKPEFGGVLFDEFGFFHHHQRQEAHTVLLGDGNFVHFGADIRRGRRRQRSG
jgi:hypothetical protein